MNGSVNLSLMRTLYWLFTFVLIAVGYGNMPLSVQLKDGFPRNTVIGKICLDEDFSYSKESVKARLMGFAFPFLWLMYGYLWSRRVYNYISGQNLNQSSFSAYRGKYRRNIFTYAETLSYNSYWCLFIITENFLLFILEIYSQDISKDLKYFLHNSFCTVFIDIFHGLFLPLKYLSSSHNYFSSSREERNPSFYVRDPELIPRRQCPKSPILVEQKHVSCHDRVQRLRRRSRLIIRGYVYHTLSTIKEDESEFLPVSIV